MPGKKRGANSGGDYEDGTVSSIPTSKRSRKEPVRYQAEQSSASNNATSSKNIISRSKVVVYDDKLDIPSRDKKGCLVFSDHPEFRPNLTPKEVLQRGSFGGTYFRQITSGVTGETYKNSWKEFPSDWFDGLNVATQIASHDYRDSVNTYGVSCGGDLHMWESSGWITDADPYGWFQWYCRFYLGRRCSDDARQISRALGVMGPTGRWRRNLINKILARGAVDKAVADKKVAPKVRQLLQHWGYEVALEDVKSHSK